MTSHRKATHIDMTSLLLLGAPDGKTDLIEGSVRRVVTLHSTEEARSAFIDLAREICLNFEEVPAESIEPPFFECGRFELQLIEPATIVLDTAVSADDWDAFVT